MGFSKIVLGFAAGLGLGAYAGENLIKNGTFEGTATANAWGSYANQSGFKCTDWNFLTPNTCGLGTPNGTWMASGLAVGTYALFIQTNGSNESKVAQNVAVPAGHYHLTFKHTARPNMGGVTATISFGTNTLGTINTTATTLQTFTKDFKVETAGTYQLLFYQKGNGADRANVIEDVQLAQFPLAVDDVGYSTFADGMLRANADSTFVYEENGGAATFASGTYTWNGNLPKVVAPGVVTVKGEVKIVANGGKPGTYTLLEAGSFNFEAGASFVLDASVTDGLARSLAVEGNQLVLTVARKPAAEVTDYVINPSFDLPGTQYGVNGANTWSYSYQRAGFALSNWDVLGLGLNNQSVGLSAANGTWLAAGQKNGGTLSCYFQGLGDAIAQTFGPVVSGVYRWTYNATARPNHGNSAVAARLVKDGTVIHTAETALINYTAFAQQASVLALPAGEDSSWGIQLAHRCPDGGDHTAVLDDISFRREAVTGWSIDAQGLTTLGAGAEIPFGSYVDGNAVLAANSMPVFSAIRMASPGLTVAGTLTVKGAITVSLTDAETLDEGYFTLIKANSIVMEDGASFVLDPETVYYNSGTIARGGLLEVDGTTVRLRVINNDRTSSNNYLKPESERTNTRYFADNNWSREHYPNNDDANVICYYPGTLLFDEVAQNYGKTWYIRNGLSAPLVFTANCATNGLVITAPYAGYNICGGINQAGWLEFRSGHHEGLSICVNGTSGSNYTQGRLDFTGAEVVLSDCIQCGWGLGTESWVNISAGSVTARGGYNSNITGRSRHSFLMTGGTFTTAVMQLLSGTDSRFDGELRDGEMVLTGAGMVLGYNAVGSAGVFNLTGGRFVTDKLLTRGDVVFNCAGGVIAAYANSSAWLQGGTLTVANGKAAIFDTNGNDAMLAATIVDAAGGAGYALTKRGLGTLTLDGDQAFTGKLTIEGGVLAAQGALAASAMEIGDGGCFSMANGAVTGNRTLPALTLAGGGRLKVDVDANGCDSFTPQSLDLVGASASNPSVIEVNLLGLEEIELGKEYCVIAGGLAAGDAAKFVVAGTDAKVKVKDGALYLISSQRVKVAVEWSGAADDGALWSTGGNWTGDEAPQNGDTAVFNLESGGATVFDVTGLSLGGLRFGATAGDYVHGGEETLRISGAITNLSSGTQTFTLPLALGIAGKSVEVQTDGALNFTGKVTTVGSTLVKSGMGALGVPDTAMLSAQNVVVKEGTLRIDERTGDATASRRSTVFLTTDYQIVWRNVKLSEVTGATARTAGSSIVSGNPYESYHWTNDGTTATVQFQRWDDVYTKCVIVELVQEGPDVKARALQACYSAQNSKILGQDMSSGQNPGVVATTDGASGYGVVSLSPAFAGEVAPDSITVQPGARLDVNIGATGGNVVKEEPTHGKTVFIAGEGPDGEGALYNSVPHASWSAQLGKVVLTDDATVGGAHMAVRPSLQSSAYEASIRGPHTLTVKTGKEHDGFNLCRAEVDLDRIDVLGKLMFEGNSSGIVSNGIHLLDGGRLRYYNTTLPTNMPVCVDSGATTTLQLDSSADSYMLGAFSVESGAKVTVDSGRTLWFRGPVTNNGEMATGGGHYFVGGPTLDGAGSFAPNGNWLTFAGSIDSPATAVTMSGTGNLRIGGDQYQAGYGFPKFGVSASTFTGSLYFSPNQSGTIEGDGFAPLVASAGNVRVQTTSSTATTTVERATWTINGQFIPACDSQPGLFVIGEGATVNQKGTMYVQEVSRNGAPAEAYIEVKEGGTLNYERNDNGLQLARVWQNHTRSRQPMTLRISGGTVNAANATMLVGTGGSETLVDLQAGRLAVSKFDIPHATTYLNVWRDAHRHQVKQSGGVLELGAGAFNTVLPSQGTVHADLGAGTLKAMGNVTPKYGQVAAVFGESAVGGREYTFDLNGKAVTWNEGLAGGSDVTITGEGTFVSTVNQQGIPLGKWTVTNTTTEINLRGAAGFAGGLTLAPGTSASVDIAGEGLIEYGMFNTANFANFDACVAYEGTLPGTVNAMREIHTTWSTEASKAFGNSTFGIARGEFEVPADQAGTWYFAGSFDDNIALFIDGEQVFKTTGWSVVGTGSRELTAGWHQFKICTADGTGSAGPWQENWRNTYKAVGWTRNSAKNGSVLSADYTRFDSDTLKMRLPSAEKYRTSVRYSVKGALGTSNYSTYNTGSDLYVQYEFVTNTMNVVNAHGSDATTYKAACGTNVRADGYFKVEADKAGDWTFTGVYDDRLTLVIDGTKLIETAAWNSAITATRNLQPGWHAFTIYASDGSTAVGTGYGPNMTDDNGVRCAVKIKTPGAAKTLAFNGNNFPIAANAMMAAKYAEMAGLGGVTTLGADATLRNGSDRGSCPIYGTLAGSGALNGRFAFAGTNSAVRVRGKSGRLVECPDLTAVTDTNYLKGLVRIEANFPDTKPTGSKYPVGPAGALTSAEAAAIKVTVKNMQGETETDWKAVVVDGKLAIANPHPGGIVFFFR